MNQMQGYLVCEGCFGACESRRHQMIPARKRQVCEVCERKVGICCAVVNSRGLTRCRECDRARRRP